MVTLVLLRILTPLLPVPTPSMSSPCSRTSEFAGVLMTMPLDPPVARTPAVPVEGQLIVSDLVIVTAPKPPGSRQLISPPVAVFEMAPAKVWQGAVRLHGLASLPTPETQVRVACAAAGSTCRGANRGIAKMESRLCFMVASQATGVAGTGFQRVAAAPLILAALPKNQLAAPHDICRGLTEMRSRLPTRAERVPRRDALSCCIRRSWNRFRSKLSPS